MFRCIASTFWLRILFSPGPKQGCKQRWKYLVFHVLLARFAQTYESPRKLHIIRRATKSRQFKLPDNLIKYSITHLFGSASIAFNLTFMIHKFASPVLSCLNPTPLSTHKNGEKSLLAPWKLGYVLMVWGTQFTGFPPHLSSKTRGKKTHMLFSVKTYQVLSVLWWQMFLLV